MTALRKWDTGTYFTGFGAVAAANCSACLPGTFSTILGGVSSDACVACAPGTYSTAVASASPCLNCSIGLYSAATGLSSPSGCVGCALLSRLLLVYGSVCCLTCGRAGFLHQCAEQRRVVVRRVRHVHVPALGQREQPRVMPSVPPAYSHTSGWESLAVELRVQHGLLRPCRRKLHCMRSG